ncbi:hypothetical protein J437_LFUL011660 [Ladona fulva]|uniref:PiggyBac transposable element-derived protein domain-containing protein n=1 Tax=Ladona fulva TaxID=123851 RepID=A0A8K0KDZ9_LADFU|nr:hypothetical protein J437_LFUL011660 [Ladona fulva]
MEPLFGSGRGVTMDNYFTSVPTAEFLIKKKITMTGTMIIRKPDIPSMMETAKGRELLSSKFIFTDNIAVISYVPKKNKTVRVLSTQFIDDSVSNESHKKPQMILEYNRTKCGVDNADTLVREYRFLLDLGKELTQPNILRRAKNPIGLQLPVLRAIEATGVFVVGNTAEKSIPTTSGQQQSRKRRRFYNCPRKNDRKVNSICCECERFV